jgi:hypothetical protein
VLYLSSLYCFLSQLCILLSTYFLSAIGSPLPALYMLSSRLCLLFISLPSAAFSLPALSLLTACSLPALCLLSTCSLPALNLLAPCSLPSLCLLSAYSLPALCLLSACSQPTRYLLSACSLPALCLHARNLSVCLPPARNHLSVSVCFYRYSAQSPCNILRPFDASQLPVISFVCLFSMINLFTSQQHK